MADLNVNSIGDASGGNTATINTFTPTVSNMAGRNRIINGDMRIDQRNAGAASANTIDGYFLDRWLVQQWTTGKLIAQQNAGSVTPPTGFTNYLGVTSQSAYAVTGSDKFTIQQMIEGFNAADLGWGTANAQTVTLGFWVRSSLTGTFGGAFANSASTRSYPYSYTISSANTWEYKTVVVAGDTSGTWIGATNGVGIRVYFGLGVVADSSGTAGAWASANYRSATGATSVVGTSGATFYITGVQLEAGSVATPFEHRQYGQELALCQRYFHVEGGNSTYEIAGSMGNAYLSNYCFAVIHAKASMRAVPTLTKIGTWVWNDWSNTPQAAGALTLSPNESGKNTFFIYSNGTTAGLTALRSYYLAASNDITARLQFSAEL